MKKDQLRVLIVEDDPFTRATIKAMLTEMKVAQIYEVQDGTEAEVFIKEAALMIDFIICDWNMPSKNGFEFLTTLRQSYSDLPFLMITARADENSVTAARKAGVNAYIRKPFPYAVLEQKIESLFCPQIDLR